MGSAVVLGKVIGPVTVNTPQNGPRMRRVRGPHCKRQICRDTEFRGTEVVVRIFPFRANHRLMAIVLGDSPI